MKYKLNSNDLENILNCLEFYFKTILMQIDI